MALCKEPSGQYHPKVTSALGRGEDNHTHQFNCSPSSGLGQTAPHTNKNLMEAAKTDSPEFSYCELNSQSGGRYLVRLQAPPSMKAPQRPAQGEHRTVQLTTAQQTG